MATRNQTYQFRKRRDALKSVRAPLSSSASGSGGPVIEMVSASLLGSNRNRSAYAPLSTEDPGPSRSLMPSFGDGNEEQHTIEALTREITELLRRSEKRLQKFPANGSSEDSNVRKNVQRSLATDLQNLSMDLRRKQSTYLKSLRQQNEGNDGADLEMNLNGSRSQLEDDEFGDLGFNEQQLSRLRNSEQFTVEREREIKQVVQSFNELAQIMKDLSVLVIDQGTIVDRIDYNIQNVATAVEEGFKQLQKAEKTQKEGGMVRCATILVIMCFVMLVLLVLKEILL
ncbi:syntaxin-43 isoform X5 [Ziziphus jujuba]|uniref:Syntaxin-43 isoform X5 n=1 Tax=Ziziphus jujuba TaxID=326968 RepID=A0ABM3IVP1_ZIZJJ|nr:syntaxin-43 isoform X5 [Ziziphus jujuba]